MIPIGILIDLPFYTFSIAQWRFCKIFKALYTKFWSGENFVIRVTLSTNMVRKRIIKTSTVINQMSIFLIGWFWQTPPITFVSDAKLKIKIVHIHLIAWISYEDNKRKILREIYTLLLGKYYLTYFIWIT